jgi:Undecaprenyl-phosphate glucose phosphotransferase
MSEGIKLHGDLSPATQAAVPLRLSETTIGALIGILDAVLITTAAVLLSFLYEFTAGGEVAADRYFGLGVIVAILFMIVAKPSGLYTFSALLGFERTWSRIVLVWLLVIMIFVLFLFLLKIGAEFSRGTVLLFSIFGPVFLIGGRSISASYLRAAFARGATIGRRAIVIGEGELLARMTGLDLAKRFAITELGRVTLTGSAEVDGTLDNAVNLARHTVADEVLLALPWNDTARLELLRERLRVLPVTVRLLPDRPISEILKLPLRDGGMSLSIELQRSPLTIAEQFSKRLCDLVIATIALVALLPLLVVTALAIKLDSAGPVIFRQRRNGFNGREFVILKFRTMTVQEDGPEIPQATRHDDRVTRLGRMLRRASIDELPQLYNVIRGEMSLVGPRPHARAHNDKYSALIAEYAFRHHVKPGITGWAQVNGFRGETIAIEQMQQRVEHDLWYIDNWSLGLDLTVLLRSCFEVARGTMAY